MHTAKIFQSGNSQAVRLPKDFRFDEKEVEIFKRGDEIVLRKIPKNLKLATSLFVDLSDDFMSDGRDQPKPQERDHSDEIND